MASTRACTDGSPATRLSCSARPATEPAAANSPPCSSTAARPASTPAPSAAPPGPGSGVLPVVGQPGARDQRGDGRVLAMVRAMLRRACRGPLRVGDLGQCGGVASVQLDPLAGQQVGDDDLGHQPVPQPVALELLV